jgi:hypothetical protein
MMAMSSFLSSPITLLLLPQMVGGKDSMYIISLPYQRSRVYRHALVTKIHNFFLSACLRAGYCDGLGAGEER